MPTDEIFGSHPTLALAAFAGSLLAGRRVAVIGDATTPLAERAAVLSQRRVHAYDPVPERAAAAIAAGGDPQVSHAPLDEALVAHDGAFDAVLLADRGGRDLGELIALAARLLSARGFLLLSSPNPDVSEGEEPGYYELYDAVSEHFEHVRMLGQAPFVGYTVAEFALEGEPAVTIDTSLVARSEEPRHYLALASPREIGELEPYTLVQMPLEGIASFLFEAPVVDTVALAEAQLRMSALASELERLKEREREARQTAKDRQTNAALASTRFAELEAERDQARRELHELRARHDRELASQRQATEDAVRRAREAEERIRKVEREAERGADGLGRERRRQEAALAEAQQRALRAETALAGAQQRAERAETRAQEASSRAEAAEQKLREASSRAEAAERKLRETPPREAKNRVAELEAALARARAQHAAALEAAADAHQEELDAMLERIAELEGDEELEPVATTAPSATAPAEAAPSKTVPSATVPETPSPEAIRGLEFQIGELKKALAEARRERDEARARAAAAEREAKAPAPAAVVDEDAEVAAELSRLEKHLEERGQRVATLERELREAERIGRELVRRFQSAPAAPAAEGPDVEALLLRCSRCEADLQAARWRLASLEEQAAPGVTLDEASTLLEDALRRSQAEVAELRRALATRGE